MNPEILPLGGELAGSRLALPNLPALLQDDADGGVRVVPQGAGEAAAGVRVALEGGQCLVSATGGATLFVNGREAPEAVVSDRDLIQIGRGGPRCVFHAGRQRRETKGMPQILSESISMARSRGRTTRIGMAFGVGREVLREAISHGTRKVRTLFWVLLAVLLGGGALLVHHLGREQARREETEKRMQASMEELEQQVHQRIAAVDGTLQALSLRDKDLERNEQSLIERLEEARENLEQTQAKVGVLEKRGKHLQELVRESQKAVAFVMAVIGWEEEKTHLPLRLKVLFPGGPPLRRADGSLEVTIDGKGPEVLKSYFGTGFLVDGHGTVVTNRHVAVPWREDERSREFEARGLKPLMRRLRIYLPGHSQALAARVLRVSEEADVGLLAADLGDVRIAPLALAPPGAAPQPGSGVVLIGYPAGVAGLVVKLGDKRHAELLGEVAKQPDYDDIVARLAAWDAIRPTVTSGLLGEALPHKLIYEAATTSGGSGSPVIDAEGKVIGVNYAIFRGFRGQNFGVPVHFVHALLDAPPQVQAQAADGR